MTANELNRGREDIRCMSNVFDDLALELGIAPHDYGDPDLLFDAIDELKAKNAHQSALLAKAVEALGFYADRENYDDDGAAVVCDESAYRGVIFDLGEKAKQALVEINKGEPK